jgi:hypothetical protein
VPPDSHIKIQPLGSLMRELTTDTPNNKQTATATVIFDGPNSTNLDPSEGLLTLSVQIVYTP